MSKNKKYFLNLGIVIIFMLFFRFIPPAGSMTELGMTLFGIFLGALWGWINCDLIVPSVLALVMAGFTDHFDHSVSTVLTSAVSNPSVQLILWLLIFSSILTISGISEQLANRLISSKSVKGHPWLLTVFVYLTCLIPAAFGTAFAAILLCWEFIYTITKQVNYTKEDKWPKMMIVGAVLACSAGTVIMPFTAGVVATFGYLSAADASYSYNYLIYLIFTILLNVIIASLYFLFCKFIIKPDMSKLTTSIDVGDIKPFTQKQKIAVIGLIAMIIFTILPSCLPACALKTFLNTLGTTAIVLIIAAIVTLFRNKEGKSYFDFQEMGRNGVFWGMLFMVATAVTLGTALATGDTGFSTSIVNLFMPLFKGASPYVFAIFIVLATLVLTNIINNAVASAIMVPVMFSFASTTGVNPVMMTALICLTSDMGMLLPSASPYAAMLYSNKEWISTKSIFRYSMIGLAATFVAVAAVGIPLGNFLF